MGADGDGHFEAKEDSGRRVGGASVHLSRLHDTIHVSFIVIIIIQLITAYNLL